MAKARGRSVVRYVRSKRRGHRKGFTVPLALVAGFAPMIQDTVTLGIQQVPHIVAYNLAGYNTWDGTYSTTRMIKGWTPIIAGFVVHKLASKFGINRAIAGAGIPFVRI